MVVKRKSKKRSSKSNIGKRKSRKRRSQKKYKQVGGNDLWIQCFSEWKDSELKKIALDTLKEGETIAGHKTPFLKPENYLAATLLNFYKNQMLKFDKNAEEELQMMGEKVTPEAKKELFESYKLKEPKDMLIARSEKMKKETFKLRVKPFLAAAGTAIGAGILFMIQKKKENKSGYNRGEDKLDLFVPGMGLAMISGLTALFGLARHEIYSGMNKDSKRFVKIIQSVWNENPKLHNTNEDKITQKFVLETFLNISRNSGNKNISKVINKTLNNKTLSIKK